MAVRARPILGVDITQKEIRVVQMSGIWPNVQIMLADSIPTPENTVENGRIIAPDVAAVALRGLLSNMRVATREAVVGIAACAMTMRVIGIPRVPDSEIDMLIAGEMEHLHLLHEAGGVFDYAFLPGEQTDQSAKISVLLMAVEAQMLSGYREFAASAGLRLLALEPILFAMYRMAYLRMQDDPFTVGLAIGADSTEIAVVNQGKIGLYRRITIGADDLIRGRKEAQDAASAFPLTVDGPSFGGSLLNGNRNDSQPLRMADPAPDPAGPPPEAAVYAALDPFEPPPETDAYPAGDGPAGPLSEADAYPAPGAVEPPSETAAYTGLDVMWARSLATELERSLDYYRRQNSQSVPIRRIFLTTDDPEIEPLASWLSYGLALDVIATGLPVGSDSVVSLPASGSERFAGAAGLAMRDLPAHPADVPRFDLVRRRKRVSQEVMAVRRKIAVSLLATAILIVYGLASRLPLRARADLLERTLAMDRQTLASRQFLLATRIRTRQSQQEDLDTLRGQTIPFAPIMDAIVGAMDPFSSLVDVSMTPAGSVVVNGEAINEQAIINTLNGMRASPYFDHPTLDSYHSLSTRYRSVALIQFTMSAPLAGGNAGSAPLQPGSPQGP